MRISPARGTPTVATMTKPPNVVVIIADDTDPFNLGCYGGDDYLTPHLDALAGSGMQFMKAEVVAPVCTPSRWCYLTGKYPGRCTGARFRGENRPEDLYNITWNTDLQPGEANLATMLRDAEFTTGYVGKFHAGRKAEDVGLIPLERGHDPYSPESVAALRSNQEKILAEMRTLGWSDPRCVTWGNLDYDSAHNIETHNVEWTTAAALSFLEDHQNDDEPFCLYYGMHTIHGPKHGENLLELDPLISAAGPLEEIPDSDMPSRASVLERLRKRGIDPYHRNVGALWMDDAVGAIVRRLEKLGLREKTLVVFKADHGKFNKATVYDAGARIPLIWNLPARIESASRNHQIVQNVDFLPTLLDFLGLAAPEGSAMDGQSYRHLLEGAHAPLREFIYNEMGMTRSIRTDRWKYIAFRYQREILEKLASGELEQAPNHIGAMKSEGGLFQRQDYFAADQLYELQQDRYENINLAGHPDYAEILATLRRELARVTATFDHPFPADADPLQTGPDYRELGQRALANAQDALGAGSFFGGRYW